MKTLIKLLDKNLDYIKHCIEDDIIYIEVASNRDIVKCPYCGNYSSKVHSRYTKFFQDWPIDGKKLLLILITEKYFVKIIVAIIKHLQRVLIL